MNGYWTIPLLIFLIRSLVISGDGDGCKDSVMKLLMLNGHYVRWPSQKMSETLVENMGYIPKNIIYTRFQLCDNNVFLAAPRYKHGVPFTLGKTFLKTNQPSFDTLVDPFPCVDNIGKSSCAVRTLVNVVDLVMGTDGILWVLDIGVSDTLSDPPSREGDPKVVGFNVATGNIKHLISLRSLNCKIRSRYQYLAVEQMKEEMTVLYVRDSGTRSIIVWDVQRNAGSRLKLPQKVVQSYQGNQNENVFHMALVELETGNYIYFTYTSSQEVFRIRTKHLRNRNHINLHCVVSVGRKPGKMIFVGVGYGSILYFRLKGRNDLYSWDSKLSLIDDNMRVVRKSHDCRTITHVDVDNEGTLWVLESDIEDFVRDRTGCYGPNVLLMAVRDPPVPITDEFDK